MIYSYDSYEMLRPVQRGPITQWIVTQCHCDPDALQSLLNILESFLPLSERLFERLLVATDSDYRKLPKAIRDNPEELLYEYLDMPHKKAYFHHIPFSVLERDIDHHCDTHLLYNTVYALSDVEITLQDDPLEVVRAIHPLVAARGPERLPLSWAPIVSTWPEPLTIHLAWLGILKDSASNIYCQLYPYDTTKMFQEVQDSIRQYQHSSALNSEIILHGLS